MFEIIWEKQNSYNFQKEIKEFYDYSRNNVFGNSFI